MAGAKRSIQGLLAFLRRAAVQKVLALVLLSIGTAFLVVEDVQVPTGELHVGQVADRDIRAPVSFNFTDENATHERQQLAEGAVQPVFDQDTNQLTRVRSRIAGAFDLATQRYTEALLKAKGSHQNDVSVQNLSDIAADFLKVLDVRLDEVDIQRVIDARWDRRIDAAAREFVGVALSGYVVGDRSELPSPPRPLSVLRLIQSTTDEVRLDSYEQIKTPEEVRQAISLYALEHAPQDLDNETLRSALAIARAAVRPNLFYDKLLTDERKSAARDGVALVSIPIQRGTAIVRAGDVVTEQNLAMLEQLEQVHGGEGAWEAQLAVAALCAMAFTMLYGFGAGYIRRFSTEVRDVHTMAFMLLLVLGVGRVVRSMSPMLATVIGYGVTPSSFWYLMPVAGGAMLVRVLINAETALLFVLPSSVLAGLLVNQQILFVLYFMVVGIAGVGGVAASRERIQILKAGLQTGLVGGVAALLLGLANIHLGDVTNATNMSSLVALWDVGLAILGGLFSAFMVLAFVPVFEQLGYLTDYKLLELANLNHPLIKQLMLRAPGSYHHSIIVATLSEAGAEAIGGNALLARVSCYFHDVGKAFKPQYFIENQRDAPNRHNRLEPRVSARIIVNHVLDGAAVARQYKLPAPIIDSIYMHHGTGLIPFFYAKALERASPGEEIDEAEFRYPGPRPNTRETGVIMLADKAEAACRTLKVPNEQAIRDMMQKLVNGIIEDGQFEDCPLTLKELYTILDTFTHTLVGIYHQRIEYPGLPRVAGANKVGGPRGTVITLEVPSPFRREGDTDYGEHAEDEDDDLAEPAEKA